MGNKKNLLFVTHALAPEIIGGVEVYARNLYEAFKRSEKIKAVLLTRSPRRGKKGLITGDRGDPSLFFIGTSHMNLVSLKNGGSYDAAFRSFLSRLRPDFVHFQHYLHLSLDWFKVVREVLPSAKILLTLHEYILLCPKDGRMIKTRKHPKDTKHGHLCNEPFSSECERCFPFWDRRAIRSRRSYVKECLKNVDLFTAPSNFLRNAMAENLGLPQEKIIYSENGQPVFRKPLEKEKKAGRLTLGFVGQIKQCKGLHVLLAAMAQVEGIYDIQLKIHGARTTPRDEIYFRLKIKPLLRRLKQVEYCGPYTREQLPDILSELDMVVVPSVWWENSPLVIQEAFMAKVPVICSNIGGMAEKVTDGVNGLHFAVNDAEDLARKIMEVYKNRKKLNLFKQHIPRVKTIEENRVELENLYLSL